MKHCRQDCRILVDIAAKQATLGQVMVTNGLTAGMEVYADPPIVEVFYSLLDNPARYGGKITTNRFFAEEAGDVHIVVCGDDGVGIPAEEKEMIFERGFGKNKRLGLFLSCEILSITGITIKETGEPIKGHGLRFMSRRVHGVSLNVINTHYFLGNIIKKKGPCYPATSKVLNLTSTLSDDINQNSIVLKIT